jgi:hypothetical protein
MSKKILVKSHEDSFFLRMHRESKTSCDIFKSNPKLNDEEIVILQVLIDNNLIVVEVVYLNDYILKK